MTGPSPQARTLSGDQQRAIERARAFLRAAAAGPRTLAAYLGAGAVGDTGLFYATDGSGSAMAQMADLLAILDELAPAQPTTGTAGGAMTTPPHGYIPDGPVETAPYLGYERPEIRHAAFAAAGGPTAVADVLEQLQTTRNNAPKNCDQW